MSNSDIILWCIIGVIATAFCIWVWKTKLYTLRPGRLSFLSYILAIFIIIGSLTAFLC